MTPAQHEWLQPLDMLQLSAADRSSLHAALTCSDPSHTVRAALGLAIRQTLAVQRPERLDAFDTFCALPVLARNITPFTMRPLSEGALIMARAATLAFDDLSLADAMHRLARTSAAQMNQLPIVQPFLIACDGKLKPLLDQLPVTTRLFFGRGSASASWVSPSHAHVRYEDMPAALLSLMLSGYMIGQLDCFGIVGDVQTHVVAPSVLDIEVRC